MSRQTSIAYYRLPGESKFVRLISSKKPEVIASLSQTEGRDGFLIYPFQPTSDTPPLFLTPEVREELELQQSPTPPQRSDAADEDIPDDYRRAFAVCQMALREETCEKLVLSRTKRITLKAQAPEKLFQLACQVFSDCYVCLFETPQTGTWLVASPETLLAQEGSHYETMSLAGTIAREEGATLSADDFGDKNQREQALVTQYLQETLHPLAAHLQQGERHVRCVGGIAHLETRFTFRAAEGVSRADLLTALHPTPAVCGQPKAKALEILLAAERAPRRYYAGFSGPLSPTRAHLYVTLRCAEISDETAIFHAGGGLLRESVMEDEWRETCRKIAGIESLFMSDSSL